MVVHILFHVVFVYQAIDLVFDNLRVCFEHPDLVNRFGDQVLNV